MNLDGIGVVVRLYAADDTDDLGLVHAPLPIEPDDLLAREHGPVLRVVRVLPLDPGGRVAYVAEVAEARLGITG
jgi:hypothetical protein